MALANLPVELLHEVCRLVDRSDTRNLRVVCRNLYPIASAYTMRELVFIPTEHDLQFLQDMARHPLYHEHVRSLVCVSVPPTLAPIRETWEDFRRRFRILESCSRPAVADAGRPRPDPIREELVRHWYGMFERAWHEQDELFRQSRDYEAIRDVIGRLPNLSEVTVSRSDDRPYFQRKWAPFYHPSFKARFGPRPSEGRADCRNAWAVLKGVHAAGTQLRALRLGTLPFEFLVHNDIGLDDLVHLFGRISEFQLRVTGLRMKHDPSSVVLSRKFAANGYRVLRAAIGSMPNLADVDLEFREELDVSEVRHLLEDELNFLHPRPRVHWENLFTPGQAWLNLQSLRLQGVDVHRRQLVIFLEGQPKLVCLRLLDVDLGLTSWLRLLPQMKTVLSRSRIGTVELGGELWGRSEDGEGSCERWSFYKPGCKWGPGPLAIAIGEYFRGPDEMPCPLTTANTDKFDFGPEICTDSDEVDDVEQWGPAILSQCPTTLEA